MKYYRVYTDFKGFIPIDETELEKALGAFKLQVGVVFKEGATDKIQKVIPDFHRIMGWNYGYELTPEDFNLIENDPECIETKKLFGQVKDRVEYLVATKQINLIGKNVEIKELNSASDLSKQLSDKFKR